MKFIYLIIFCLFYSFNSHALEFSCIDKKYGRFSKMFIEDQLLKYEDEKAIEGNVAKKAKSDLHMLRQQIASLKSKLKK